MFWKSRKERRREKEIVKKVEKKIEKDAEEGLEKAVSIIVKDKLGRSIQKIERIEKPFIGRTIIYKVTLDNQEELFCKEYFAWNSSRDITKKSPRGTVGSIIEEKFLKYLTDRNGFSPTYYGSGVFIDEKRNIHLLYITEHYPHTLEDKLLELFAKKKEHPEQKEPIENETYDYLRRVIDIYLVNNRILSSLNRDEFYTVGTTFLSGELESAYNTLFRYLNSKLGTEFLMEWVKRGVSTDKNKGLMETLNGHIVRPLSDESNYVPSLYMVHPSHVLLKTAELPQAPYDCNSILQIRDGQKQSTPYDGFAIGDLAKVGLTTSVLGLAVLLNSPQVTQLLPEKRINELVEHALVAREKVLRGKDALLETISEMDKNKFREQFNAASRYEIYRALTYITALALNYPEALESYAKKKEIYSPGRWINVCLDRFVDISDPDDYFSVMNKGILNIILPRLNEFYRTKEKLI